MRHAWLHPRFFSPARRSDATAAYFDDPAALKLAEFFHAKGLAALKDEDRRQAWYDDWLTYQATHHLYASVISPRKFSSAGTELDLFRYARFLEAFGYFSPAHGYGLQVSFLGLFPILMGSNVALKQEAIAALEAGGLFAFGISEKQHGADLLGNEFHVETIAPDRFRANGSKYYIGNANCASIISILARHSEGQSRRSPFVLFALRPKQSPGYQNVRKIHTMGVRCAFVGEFEVRDHEFPQTDIIAQGRAAWDCVFGTITLGKLFLGFGSIGICERAFEEAANHLSRRILYGKPAIQMPHLRSSMEQAYARLTAMKLYAYRALDYVQAATAVDRRYLLYCAVQKAKVSTEGVKVVAQLAECIGARAFDGATWFEMAMRDVQLIPPLEGSTHINLGLTARFMARYFERPDGDLAAPPSFADRQSSAGENEYLYEARSGAINSIAFAHFLEAYRPLASIPNVRIFARQAKAFQLFARKQRGHHGPATTEETTSTHTQAELLSGQCLATIAYGQLIAECAVRVDLPAQLTSAIFHLLIHDLSSTTAALASLPQWNFAARTSLRRIAAIPRTTAEDWEFISGLLAAQ